MRQINHEEFLEKFYKKFPKIDFEIIGTYEHNQKPILLRDKYGDCLIAPNHLMQRSKPSVKTAIDKTQYTINKFKEQWGDLYDYSEFEYKGARQKGIIKCRKHGAFLQDANMHLSGRCGCFKCANEAIGDRLRSNTQDFINKAVEKYGNEKYTFENTQYKTATENVIITCAKHGDFEQTPNRFLNGQICKKCAYKENTANYHLLRERRNNSVLYVIECFDNEERFIKIGVTTKSVRGRFSDKTEMPYEYNILREFRYANTEAAHSLETYLLNFTKSAMYNPKLKFSGRTETRILDIKNAVLELFDAYTDQLYYSAFVNFIEAYSGVFDKDVLRGGNYTKIEIDTVMKGYQIHQKLNLS